MAASLIVVAACEPAAPPVPAASRASPVATTPTRPASPTSAARLGSPSPAASPSARVVPPSPVAARSISPAASPAASPTASLEPSPPARSAAALAQQVARAEAELQTGSLEATIDLGEDARSTVTLVFDLGDRRGPSQRLPSLQSTSIYTSRTERQAVERIMYGDRVWQRRPGGAWATAPEQETVWGQIQPYLPQSGSAPNPDLVRIGEGDALHWFEPVRAAEVTLEVDPATGVPQRLRRESRASGSVLVVSYTGWNIPVAIRPPE